MAMKGKSVMAASDWCEPGAEQALLCLAIDDLKGNTMRKTTLPQAVYADCIAPFLRFGEPLPNQLYAVGGRNAHQGPLNTVEMFDSWHGCWVACPSMSARRAGCAAVVLQDRRMLVIGGYDENGIVKGLLSSCEAFDPKTQQWDVSIQKLSRARWGHGCACLNDLVYVVGGCSLRPGAPPRESFMETLKSCEIYDASTNKWRESAELQMARAGSRVVALGSRHLAAVGGCDDVFGRAEMLPTVELFDIETGRWSLLDTTLSTPRTTAAVAALDDRKVLVVGGAPCLSSIEVFSIPDKDAGQADASCLQPRLPVPSLQEVSEGRMGCQAVTMQLPATGDNFPLCTRPCVVVVGGENGDEEVESDTAQVRQFATALVYDVEAADWLPGVAVPAMSAPRTAMALCVGYGRIRGCPSTDRAVPRGGC